MNPFNNIGGSDDMNRKSSHHNSPILENRRKVEREGDFIC
jgi:hypothetical protein